MRCFGDVKGGQTGMIGVDKIEDIRKRGRRLEGVASIARNVGVRRRFGTEVFALRTTI